MAAGKRSRWLARLYFAQRKPAAKLPSILGLIAKRMPRSSSCSAPLPRFEPLSTLLVPLAGPTGSICASFGWRSFQSATYSLTLPAMSSNPNGLGLPCAKSRVRPGWSREELNRELERAVSAATVSGPSHELVRASWERYVRLVRRSIVAREQSSGVLRDAGVELTVHASWTRITPSSRATSIRCREARRTRGRRAGPPIAARSKSTRSRLDAEPLCSGGVDELAIGTVKVTGCSCTTSGREVDGIGAAQLCRRLRSKWP